jgi:hypothetical protein
MSFLDDCTDAACPWPHEVCEFSLCETCASCPTAQARRQASALLARQRMTRPLGEALKEILLSLPVRAPAVAE